MDCWGQVIRENYDLLARKSEYNCITAAYLLY